MAGGNSIPITDRGVLALNVLRGMEDGLTAAEIHKRLGPPAKLAEVRRLFNLYASEQERLRQAWPVPGVEGLFTDKWGVPILAEITSKDGIYYATHWAAKTRTEQQRKEIMQRLVAVRRLLAGNRAQCEIEQILIPAWKMKRTQVRRYIRIARLLNLALIMRTKDEALGDHLYFWQNELNQAESEINRGLKMQTDATEMVAQAKASMRANGADATTNSILNNANDLHAQGIAMERHGRLERQQIMDRTARLLKLDTPEAAADERRGGHYDTVRDEWEDATPLTMTAVRERAPVLMEEMKTLLIEGPNVDAGN